MQEYWESVARSLPQVPKHSLFGLAVAPYWKLERRMVVRMALSYLLQPSGGRKTLLLKTDLWNEGIDNTSGDILDFLGNMKELAEVVGIDISQVICSSARRRFQEGLNTACADVRSLPFGDGSFDAILDVSTLDHIHPGNISSVIGGYQRVLKKGGVLALIFDSETFWWVSHLRNIFNRLRYRSVGGGEFWWKLSPARVKELLVASGFEILNEFPLGILSLSPVYWKTVKNSMARRCVPSIVRNSIKSVRFTKASKYLFPFASQYLFITRKQGGL